jgi:pilus assembly protein Flp/PilA
MIAQVQIFTAWITSRIRSERGASLVEYALLVALIAAVCIVAVSNFGTAASDQFQNVADTVAP